MLPINSRVRTIIKKLNSRIFQYIPGWVELNFQDISDTVYHTSIAIKMLLSTCEFISPFSAVAELLVHIPNKFNVS